MEPHQLPSWEMSGETFVSPGLLGEYLKEAKINVLTGHLTLEGRNFFCTTSKCVFQVLTFLFKASGLLIGFPSLLRFPHLRFPGPLTFHSPFKPLASALGQLPPFHVLLFLWALTATYTSPYLFLCLISPRTCRLIHLYFVPNSFCLAFGSQWMFLNKWRFRDVYTLKVNLRKP